LKLKKTNKQKNSTKETQKNKNKHDYMCSSSEGLGKKGGRRTKMNNG
jgi:hypothetical protein